jgi:hypothetical protein
MSTINRLNLTPGIYFHSHCRTLALCRPSLCWPWLLRQQPLKTTPQPLLLFSLLTVLAMAAAAAALANLLPSPPAGMVRPAMLVPG